MPQLLNVDSLWETIILSEPPDEIAVSPRTPIYRTEVCYPPESGTSSVQVISMTSQVIFVALRYFLSDLYLGPLFLGKGTSFVILKECYLFKGN